LLNSSKKNYISVLGANFSYPIVFVLTELQDLGQATRP